MQLHLVESMEPSKQPIMMAPKSWKLSRKDYPVSGEGVAYVHTDISMKYYPLTIWCPRGYYSFNLRVVFNSDQMIGKITDNVLNGEPRSNVLKVVIRDDHKELKGKVIATTWANEEGYFYFDPSLVIPSSAWFDNSIQGKLVIEIDGQQFWLLNLYLQ